MMTKQHERKTQTLVVFKCTKCDKSLWYISLDGRIACSTCKEVVKNWHAFDVDESKIH